MSKSRRDKEIDKRFGKANGVLHKFYRFVVAKREDSNTAKLFLNRSFSHPHLRS